MNPGAWFDQILSIFSSPNLQLFLLVGSGILAISLLVLALTRWGHSRPVWKCVVLSFAAHILLMGFAYGTRMIVETPQVTQEDNPMRVNLIPETGQSTTGEDSADASENTWDQFVNQQALPNVEDLERPSIDSEVVIEKVVDRSVAKPDTESPATDLDQFPQKQEFTEPEFAQAPKQINNDFPMAQPQIAPQQIEVKRLGDPTAPLRDTPTFEPPQEMARQEISNDFAPQTTPNSEQNPMAPSQKQTPFTSDLVDVNSQLPKAPVTPPTTFKSPDFKTAPPVNGVSSTKRLKIVANPRRIGDGQPLPKIYSLRKAQNRLNVARRRGGSVETERAVESALQWLANNQEADGSWDPQKSGGGNETKVFGHDRNGAGAQAQCGITGLASLSFLAAGHSHLEGGYQQEVQKALEYLVRQQRSNGDLSGNAKMFARMYCHSMSLLALSEAFAMTGDSRLFEAVQRGVNYTVSAQNRSDGGWRYQPGDPGDMSQFGWQVLALHSAKLGGAVVPDETYDRMEKFLESCASGVGGGLASYRPSQGPSTTMTAEALLCRYFLNKNVPPMTVMEATRRIGTERPTPTHVNLYYWYYGTLAMYHVGGNDWDKWNTEMKSTLLQLQRQQGDNAGSWPANGVWGGYGGEVYSTAMATLNLEVYYRYLPIYQQLAEAKELPSNQPGTRRGGFRETFLK